GPPLDAPGPLLAGPPTAAAPPGRRARRGPPGRGDLPRNDVPLGPGPRPLVPTPQPLRRIQPVAPANPPGFPPTTRPGARRLRHRPIVHGGDGGCVGDLPRPRLPDRGPIAPGRRPAHAAGVPDLRGLPDPADARPHQRT